MNTVVERTELITPEPAIGIANLLGVPLPDFSAGAGLPLGWHWLYLLDRVAQSDLGPDGHPARGTVPTPPAPGLRRMWGGGTVIGHGRLLCGERATRHTRVIKTERKPESETAAITWECPPRIAQFRADSWR